MYACVRVCLAASRPIWSTDNWILQIYLCLKGWLWSHVHTTTTHTLTQSWTFMVLHLVLVSGPITALVAASPRRKVTFFGRRTSGPCGGRKDVRGPQPPCVAWTWDHNQPFSGSAAASPVPSTDNLDAMFNLRSREKYDISPVSNRTLFYAYSISVY